MLNKQDIQNIIDAIEHCAIDVTPTQTVTQTATPGVTPTPTVTKTPIVFNLPIATPTITPTKTITQSVTPSPQPIIVNNQDYIVLYVAADDKTDDFDMDVSIVDDNGNYIDQRFFLNDSSQYGQIPYGNSNPYIVFNQKFSWGDVDKYPLTVPPGTTLDPNEPCNGATDSYVYDDSGKFLGCYKQFLRGSPTSVIGVPARAFVPGQGIYPRYFKFATNNFVGSNIVEIYPNRYKAAYNNSSKMNINVRIYWRSEYLNGPPLASNKPIRISANILNANGGTYTTVINSTPIISKGYYNGSTPVNYSDIVLSYDYTSSSFKIDRIMNAGVVPTNTPTKTPTTTPTRTPSISVNPSVTRTPTPTPTTESSIKVWSPIECPVPGATISKILTYSGDTILIIVKTYNYTYKHDDQEIWRSDNGGRSWIILDWKTSFGIDGKLSEDKQYEQLTASYSLEDASCDMFGERLIISIKSELSTSALTGQPYYISRRVYRSDNYGTDWREFANRSTISKSFYDNINKYIAGMFLVDDTKKPDISMVTDPSNYEINNIAVTCGAENKLGNAILAFVVSFSFKTKMMPYYLVFEGVFIEPDPGSDNPVLLLDCTSIDPGGSPKIFQGISYDKDGSLLFIKYKSVNYNREPIGGWTDLATTITSYSVMVVEVPINVEDFYQPPRFYFSEKGNIELRSPKVDLLPDVTYSNGSNIANKDSTNILLKTTIRTTRKEYYYGYNPISKSPPSTQSSTTYTGNDNTFNIYDPVIFGLSLVKYSRQITNILNYGISYYGTAYTIDKSYLIRPYVVASMALSPTNPTYTITPETNFNVISIDDFIINPNENLGIIATIKRSASSTTSVSPFLEERSMLYLLTYQRSQVLPTPTPTKTSTPTITPTKTSIPVPTRTPTPTKTRIAATPTRTQILPPSPTPSQAQTSNSPFTINDYKTLDSKYLLPPSVPQFLKVTSSEVQIKFKPGIILTKILNWGVNYISTRKNICQRHIVEYSVNNGTTWSSVTPNAKTYEIYGKPTYDPYIASYEVTSTSVDPPSWNDLYCTETISGISLTSGSTILVRVNTISGDNTTPSDPRPVFNGGVGYIPNNLTAFYSYARDVIFPISMGWTQTEWYAGKSASQPASIQYIDQPWPPKTGSPKTVVAGSSSSAILLNTNDAYVFGASPITWIPNYQSPTQIKNIKFNKIALGSNANAGIDTSGKLYLWGNNSNGELLTAYTSFVSAEPFLVSASNFIQNPPPLNNPWLDIVIGRSVIYALNSNGYLYSWGSNEYGEQGLPISTKVTYSPNFITFFVSKIAAGGGHMLALRSGQIAGCGNNWLSQLGSTTPTTSNTSGSFRSIEKISTLSDLGTGWTDVFCGSDSSYGIKSDGSLWAWGDHTYGQLGVGDQVTYGGVVAYRKHTPTPIKIFPATIKTMAAGAYHCLALDIYGGLWAWGDNRYGQLGNNTSGELTVPNKIGDGFAGIAAGAFHSIAYKTDGSVYTWGYNINSQLGNNSIIDSNKPIKIL
jgi:hypothetical protein